MNWVGAAFGWIADPANWSGADGIAARLGQHLLITVTVCLIALVIALPVGMLVGHTRRGTALVVAISGGLRALPTLGALTLFALWLGVGVQAPILALVVLAIPPMLAGVYAGIQAVPRDAISASTAIGFSDVQVLTRVGVPLASASMWQGARSMVLQVVSTATLAAYVGAGGLGTYIFLGLKTRDYGLMLGGSVLVIALAFIGELAFSVAGRVLLPAGVRAARRERRTTQRQR